MEWRIVNCEWNGDISEIKYKENLVKRDSMHAHAVHTSVILFAPIGEKFKKNGFTRCSLKYFFIWQSNILSFNISRILPLFSWKVLIWSTFGSKLIESRSFRSDPSRRIEYISISFGADFKSPVGAND